MKRFFHTMTIAALSLAALSAQAASRDEAQALLKAALAEIKVKGDEGAGHEFDTNSTWTKGSLYVFVSDFKGTISAYSANAKVGGKNLWEVKDAPPASSCCRSTCALRKLPARA